MTRRRIPAVVWALLASSIWCGIARGGELPLPTAIRAMPAPDALSASIRVTVANRSDRPSDPATLEVYLSLDGLVGPEDARLGERAILPLAARTETAVAFAASARPIRRRLLPPFTRPCGARPWRSAPT